MAYIRTGGGSKPEPELLWTNPNPTSSFAAQTVSLDLSEYDTVIVKYVHNATTSSTHIYTYAVYGNPCTIVSPGSESGLVGYPSVIGTVHNYNANGYQVDIRPLTISDTEITFGTGYSTGTSVAGTKYCVPLEIYGLKATVYPS